MRVFSKLIVTVLLGATVLSCGPAREASEPTLAQKISALISRDLGNLPGERIESEPLPRMIGETRLGIQVLHTSRKAAEARVNSTTTSTTGPLNDLGQAIGSATGGGGSSSGSSGAPVSSSPSFGSGTLPTAPSSAGGSLPTAPSAGSAALPTAPSAGSGASVTLSPAAFGTVTGSASGGSLANALCTFIQGYITFFSSCSGSNDAMATALNQLGGCSGFVQQLLTTEGLTTVPAAVVQALSCIGTSIGSKTCVVATVNEQLNASFSSCGITISSSNP